MDSKEIRTILDNNRLLLAIVCLLVSIPPLIGPFLSFYIYIEVKYRNEEKEARVKRFNLLKNVFALLLLAAIAVSILAWEIPAIILYYGIALNYISIAANYLARNRLHLKHWSTTADYMQVESAKNIMMGMLLTSAEHAAGLVLMASFLIIPLSYAIWFSSDENAKKYGFLQMAVITLLSLALYFA